MKICENARHSTAHPKFVLQLSCNMLDAGPGTCYLVIDGHAGS